MSKLAPIIVAAALVFGLSSAAQAIPVVLSTFTFTGQCDISFTGNCTGTGNGTLVLQNYTLGNAIIGDNSIDNNFVSFNYHSTVFSLSFNGIGAGSISSGGIGTGGISSISGTLQNLPGPAFVMMGITAGTFFLSNVAAPGFWCVGVGCNGDTGNTSQWSETPLPATLPLFATGIGALGLLGWRRKRKAQAVA
jgi:hypothetical protein